MKVSSALPVSTLPMFDAETMTEEAAEVARALAEYTHIMEKGFTLANG